MDEDIETYPLRKIKAHAEVLLVGFASLKELMENKIGYKCEVSVTEQKAVLVVKKALKNSK